MFWLALMGQNPLPSASCKMLVFLNNHSYSSPWFGYKVWELQLERVKQASCRCCARSKPPRSTTAKKSLQAPRAQHYSALFGPYSRIPACPPDSVSSILCKWCSLPTANYHLTILVFSAEVHPVTCPAKQAIATWLDSLLSPFSGGKKNKPTNYPTPCIGAKARWQRAGWRPQQGGAAAAAAARAPRARLAAESRPESRSQPAVPQGKGGREGSAFSEQEDGEAMSVSCCAAETSKDVITFTLPQGVSRLRAKVQSFPAHGEEGGFGGETSSSFIANSVLCACIAKQLSSVLPGSAAKYRMWLETIFAQEPCCSSFPCSACARSILTI